MSDTEAAPESAEVLVVQPPASTGLLYKILSLPLIGDTLGGAVAIMPLILIFVVAGWVLGTGSAYDNFGDSTLLWVIAIPVTWMWLGMLERGAGVRLCLPLPIVSIPIRWALVAFVLYLLLETAGVFG